MSLVRLACEHGSSNVFKLLLKQGAGVNEKDKDGRYLLFVSMCKGFDDISECLVLKGTPIARSNEDKFQALDSVFNKFKRKQREKKDTKGTIRNERLLSLLISKGYTDNVLIPNAFNLYNWQVSTLRNEWTHCDFTVWDGVKYVQSLQLIENFIYLLNFTAADEKEMIEELQKWRKNEQINKGIKPNINSENMKITFKRTSLVVNPEPKYKDESVQTPEEDIYALLPDVIESLKSMNRLEDFKSTLIAIVNGHLFNNIAFHLLLDVGNFFSQSTIHNTRYSEETILFWLTIQKLFKGKDIIFFRGYKGQGLSSEQSIKPEECKTTTGLIPSLFHAYVAMMNLLIFFISVGADVDGQVGFFTPLTAACHSGHLQTVEILLKKGSNINNSNTQGETPLYTACVGSHYNLVKLLIEKEADINKQNKFSCTPLHASFDSDGKTPLHAACCFGNTDIVNLFIWKRADLDMIDVDLETPLHKACRKGKIDVIQNLLAFGADITKTNRDVQTAAHIAKSEGAVFDECILKALE
ncbi:unnamed protein product [Mytilus edulis]|uniref:Uncharacterized protein n=1 Tax=Mytilus edulis TaxID=6550 RepID=A0A8S3TSN2_MYTED|nr:unnamed protein product [Mytilus edulis]